MYKKITKKKYCGFGKKKAAVFMACLLGGITLSVCGCKTSPVSAITGSYVFKVGSEKCSDKDAKIILLNYQKEYASLYGMDMWAHDYSDGGSLEDYVKDLTISQLAEVYTLDIIADDQEVTLTEAEQQEAQAAAKEYMEGLSQEENDYLKVSENDVKALYERYLLAQKLYAGLTENISSEVSDDEARVMNMKQICVSDRDTADNILALLNNGSDFLTLASAYNQSAVTDLNVTRTTFPDDITETLVALNTGEYSGVLEIEDAYYIFYCVNSFDEELTQQNKENVRNQRMEEAVDSAYASYTDQLESVLNEKTWESIAVDTSLELEGPSFLEIFETSFGSMH